jgi:hypothetical protein
MKKHKTETPDFFEPPDIDPVLAATGLDRGDDQIRRKPVCTKRKAGYYLSETLLNRFNRKFHELKLAGKRIENKSAMLEKMLLFALDDMDLAQNSVIIKQFDQPGNIQ